MTPPLTLFTLGHSNLSQEALLQVIRNHDLAVIIDVRSAPYSRYVPHFNKQALEVFLKEKGVDYRFAGDFLGGHPKDPTVYKTEAIPDPENTQREKYLKLVDYIAVMKTEPYQRGISRLLAIIRSTAPRGVAVMCSEANPLDCHRHHLIARSLLDPIVKVTEDSLQVQHILKEGNIQHVDANSFSQSNPYQPRLI
jgi:uncharacterized protein (DUF488 family)